MNYFMIVATIGILFNFIIDAYNIKIIQNLQSQQLTQEKYINCLEGEELNLYKTAKRPSDENSQIKGGIETLSYQSDVLADTIRQYEVRKD